MRCGYYYPKAMTINDILNTSKTNLKHLKNTYIVKYKVLQKRKSQGEKINLLTFLQETKVFKKYNQKKTKTTEKKYFNIKLFKKTKKCINKKLATTIVSILGFVMLSLFSSNLIFKESNNIEYLTLNKENQLLITNILKSPKTTASIETKYNEDKNIVEYYFLIVDNLDSYSYKLNPQNISTTLQKEILNSYSNNTIEISSLKNIEITTIFENNDFYFINNKYKINKTLVSKNDSNKIYETTQKQVITNYNHRKKITISIMTAFLSIISSIFYFSTKKVISKK